MRAAVIWLRKVFLTRDTLWALILFLIVCALIVVTSDQSPLWIYQGF